VSERESDDLFRLPVDRAFTMKGTGTVVTGTVWTGALRPDDVVRIVPGDRIARVRSLQSHGVGVSAVTAGMRAAVGLSGVDVADVPRGSTLVTDEAWDATTVLRADVRTLGGTEALGPRRRVRLHLGTREVGGRVVAPGGVRGGGPATPARVVLDEPIVGRGGDRFVLRAGSPPATIGGGVVTDPLPGRGRVKPWTDAGLAAAQRLALLAHEAGGRGVACSALPVRVGLRPADVQAAAAAIADTSEVIAGVLFSRAAGRQLAEALLARIEAHHARAPLDEGVSLQELRGGSGGMAATNPVLVDETMRRMVTSHSIDIDRGLVRRSGWTPRPSAGQQAALDRLADALQAAGREPPSINELAAAGVVSSSDDAATLLRVLERRGVIRQVEQDRYYGAAAVDELTEALRRGMVPGREYGPAELRGVLGVSRKYLIPLLEYCDRIGVTERRPGGRVLRQSASREQAPTGR
jgi:selenocysteine-specific elongation factor